MKTKLLSFVLVSGIVISSCKKTEKFQQVDNKSIDQIAAPASFMWSGSRDVSLSIGVSDASSGTLIHVIKIYTAEPAKGGELISKGSATLISPFNTKVTLSSAITQVYIEKTSPTGAVVGQTLALTSDNISAAISATGLTKVMSVGKLSYSIPKTLSLVNEATPSVPAGAIVIPNGANNYQMDDNTNYVISANSASVNFKDPKGGTLYITGTGVNITQLKMKKGNTVIITGSATFSSNFSWDEEENDGTLKIFGSLTTSNFKISGTYRNQGTHVVNGTFTVSQNTTNVNSGTLTVNGNTDIDAPFENGGTMSLTSSNEFKTGSNFTNNSGAILAFGSQNTAIKGTFTNSGAVTFAGGEINLNSSNPTVVNNGTFTANNSKMNLTGSFTNSGTVSVKTLNYNSGGLIINNCKWFVTENATAFDGPLKNYSYFRITGSSNINSNGVITLYDGAVFRTGSIQALNAVVVGSGTTSVFKVDGSIDNNLINNANNQNNGSQARFSGNLEVDLSTSSYPLNATQPNSNNSNYLTYVNGLPVGFFISPAKRLLSTTTVFIPTDDCMPESIGHAPVNNDTDGDGVPNSVDDYPNDPTKAHDITSENYALGGSTVAFEDSWPKKGDYDLNDVVFTYKYKVVTNAANKVVRVEASYKLLATGGEFHNGAGIEFPLLAAKATNFTGPTGTSLESGQTNVTLILFTDSRVEQATWNTQTSQVTSPAVTYNISFDVVNGPLQSEFGFNFNPFIWNNTVGYGRGFETHLFGKKPTSKANTALFGTNDDATNVANNKYYGTATNLPWGITLPIATFKYPKEKISITDGYSLFSTWAISGGTSNPTWYLNSSSTNLFGN
ncbi:LruC domain-containing protein [Pedobacter sp. UYP24]